MRDAMIVLLRRDLGLFSRESQRYLQDIYDHLIRIVESVEDYQEPGPGTLEANATFASNRVGTVARNLGAYAAIFAVVTMISGIYGMNFHHMPELGWRFGYGWAARALMVVSRDRACGSISSGRAGCRQYGDGRHAGPGSRPGGRALPGRPGADPRLSQDAVGERHRRGHRRPCAEATGAWIEGAGGSFELVHHTGATRWSSGELPGPAGAPRLLRYGMYDVQPAQEPDWTSPPFAAEVRDLPGVGPAVVARGSANSKSCLACFFLAVEVLRELDAMPLHGRPDDRGRGGAGQPQPGRRGPAPGPAT